MIKDNDFIAYAIHFEQNPTPGKFVLLCEMASALISRELVTEVLSPDVKELKWQDFNPEHQLPPLVILQHFRVTLPDEGLTDFGISLVRSVISHTLHTQIIRGQEVTYREKYTDSTRETAHVFECFFESPFMIANDKLTIFFNKIISNIQSGTEVIHNNLARGFAGLGEVDVLINF